MNNATKKQHYLPCCYLQFFSTTNEGRKSKLFLFNGKICKEVTVESQGYDNYTYSKKDPQSAEDFFQYNFENDYPKIANKVINGEKLTLQDEVDLFVFSLVTRFRSPAYKISTGEERIVAFDGIIGSACNQIEPQVPSDWIPSETNHYLNRVSNKYKLRIIRLDNILIICDNPVIIGNYKDIFAAVIILPISPMHIAVYYQYEHLECKEIATISDYKNLILSQRTNRINNLYYPFDISHMTKADRALPTPAPNASEVTHEHVTHQYSHIDGLYNFIELKI